MCSFLGLPRNLTVQFAPLRWMCTCSLHTKTTKKKKVLSAPIASRILTNLQFPSLRTSLFGWIPDNSHTPWSPPAPPCPRPPPCNLSGGIDALKIRKCIYGSWELILCSRLTLLSLHTFAARREVSPSSSHRSSLSRLLTESVFRVSRVTFHSLGGFGDSGDIQVEDLERLDQDGALWASGGTMISCDIPHRVSACASGD